VSRANPKKSEKTWFPDMCPGGVIFSEKSDFFRVLTEIDQNRMGPYGNRQTWKTQNKPKKHEKTQKNAKTDMAESCKKRAFFLSIL
jgi:hypothetical protein